MISKRNLIFLFLFILPFRTYGLNMNFTEQLGQIFWGPVQLKLIQLPVFFIMEIQPHQILFKSKGGEGCVTIKHSSKPVVVASIVFSDSFNQDQSQHTQAIEYFGCDQEKSLFREVIFTEGTQLKKLSSDDLLSGSRDFKLNANEQRKEFLYQDGNGVTVTHFRLQRDSTGFESLHWTALDQEAVYFYYNPKEKIYGVKKETTQPMSYRYQGYRSWSQFRFFVHFLLKKTSPQQTYFFDLLSQSEISESDFQSLWEQTKQSLQDSSALPFQVLAHFFPEKKADAIQLSSRLEEELNLVLDLVETGQDMDRVKELLKSFIQSVQKGKIIEIGNRGPIQ